MQVQTLKFGLKCPTPASSHLLAEALCSMPNLTDLTLRFVLNGEFYSALRAKASSIQVQTVNLGCLLYAAPASSHLLAEALCYMPNLTDLTLGINLNEDFYSTLKAKASSIQGCFPQIRKGNFRLNGVTQDGLDSFPHTLSRSCRQLSGCFYHGNTYNTGDVSSEQSRAVYQETRASNSSVNPVHANVGVSLDTLSRGLGANIPVLQESQDNTLVRQALQQPGTLRNESGIWPVYLENNALPWNIGRSQPQFMPSNLQSSMSAGYRSMEYGEAYYNPTYNATMSSSTPSPNPPVSRHNQPATDHPQQQHMGDVHYPRKALPPSHYHQQQPMGDVHSPRRALPPSHYPQQQPMGDVHSPRRSLPPSDHPQQQPMGDVHYQRKALPPSHYDQQQPMGDVHYPRKALPPSHYPQQQPSGDVHSPRKALPPSHYDQQQPMGDVHYPRKALPPSHYHQQQPMDDVHYQRMTIPPSNHPQQHPMGYVHYPRMTIPPLNYPQQQPMGDVHYPRMTIPPSNYPQQQPMGGVHYPRRTLPPSDHP
ncbi:altered inheritance of mitochondria protein 3 [Strongylocentrotus purpuratus]|uniref:Uncharacterized protein n=1 Tax=Strongylocentrotus purpuratus TaxID=7668 RepID=A0A7M7NW00_STRPU|nr:altered inheritance of mitochondria protein 3 [Strongylocentrotus purpuratus]